MDPEDFYKSFEREHFFKKPGEYFDKSPLKYKGLT